ncbi:MAG: DivIVA domain-containing protein [candidate division Zixibacteria bacterium]|nr:DivIVA domain-containing protein [candidate division Zixibacteria bacterium]
METTPNDLRQQQFEIKFRGYNPDDVEVFRDLAATALEEAKAEILKLSEENNHISERLKHLIALEDTLKAAVIEAQKNAEVTIDNAKREAQVTVNQAEKEAELIVREANSKREDVTGDMHRKMGKLVADINKLRFIKSQYLHQLQSLVSSQLEVVDQAIEDDERDENDIQPPTPEAKPVQQDWQDTQERAAVEEPVAEYSAPPRENVDQMADSIGNDTAEIPVVAEPAEVLERVSEENAEAIAQTPESEIAATPDEVPVPEVQPEMSEAIAHVSENNEQPQESEEKPNDEEPLTEEWEDLEKQLNEEK